MDGMIEGIWLAEYEHNDYKEEALAFPSMNIPRSPEKWRNMPIYEYLCACGYFLRACLPMRGLSSRSSLSDQGSLMRFYEKEKTSSPEP